MIASVFDTEARNSFSESVDRFITQRYDFDTQRRLAATPDHFGRDEWAQIAELGWQCLPLPEAHGGMGGGAADTSIIMEAIGRGLMLEPYIASIILAGRLVAACGSAAQQADLLPALASGALVLAFAERDSDPQRPVTATPAVDCWTMNGAKTLTLHGDCADRLLVAAQVGDETGLFLVAADSAGLHRDRYRLVDGRGIAELGFDAVPAERLGNDDARAAIESALDHAAHACCAEAVGAMAMLNAQTLEFVRTRQQFGVTIGSFQVIQHRLVDMTVAEQEARSIARAAAAALDAGQPGAGLLVAAAKLRAARAGRFVGESAVQIHGGIGMSSELPIGAWFKRLLAIESLFGDADAQLDRIAALR